jgi:hypothetical protein
MSESIFIGRARRSIRMRLRSLRGGTGMDAGSTRSDYFVCSNIPNCINCMTTDANLKFNANAQLA